MSDVPSYMMSLCLACFAAGLVSGILFTQADYVKQFKQIQQISCTNASTTIPEYKQCMSVDYRVYVDRLIAGEK